MTYGMYAIAWLELGNPDNAADIFSRSYANIQQPFNVWTGTEALPVAPTTASRPIGTGNGKV
jgi:hypothetical protein